MDSMIAPGALPMEKADNVPAMLSDGEYVVPAEVLRYYGLKFFNDLKSEAAAALGGMQSEGQIKSVETAPTPEMPIVDDVAEAAEGGMINAIPAGARVESRIGTDGRVRFVFVGADGKEIANERSGSGVMGRNPGVLPVQNTMTPNAPGSGQTSANAAVTGATAGDNISTGESTAGNSTNGTSVSEMVNAGNTRGLQDMHDVNQTLGGLPQAIGGALVGGVMNGPFGGIGNAIGAAMGKVAGMDVPMGGMVGPATVDRDFDIANAISDIANNKSIGHYSMDVQSQARAAYDNASSRGPHAADVDHHNEQVASGNRSPGTTANVGGGYSVPGPLGGTMNRGNEVTTDKAESISDPGVAGSAPGSGGGDPDSGPGTADGPSPGSGGGDPDSGPGTAFADGGMVKAVPKGLGKIDMSRPIIENSDGTFSTERSITVTDPRLNDGLPTNIPSLWGGKQLNQDQSVLEALRSKQVYQSFDTIDAAVAAAKQRSEAVGNVREQDRKPKVSKAPWKK
jgi:hypothetical protein